MLISFVNLRGYDVFPTFEPMTARRSPRKTAASHDFLGISFRDSRWAHSALTHPSYRNEAGLTGLEDFERLEFFGDAILNYVICRAIYDGFPEADEGLLTRIRSILVSRKILARIARELGLHRHLLVDRQLKALPLETKNRILADALESFLAAIYFDRGLKEARGFILLHFGPYMNLKRLFRLNPNPKSTLQEISQKRWRKLPVYQMKELGSGCRVTVKAGRRQATACGRSRRDAEEKAARLLIRKIRYDCLPEPKTALSGRKLRKLD